VIVTGVDFVGIPTRDLDRAAEFYGTTLGLPRSVWIPERSYSEFETGNLTLSIYHAENMGLQHNPVRNAPQARALLEQAGVTFSADTLDTGVCHMAFFEDPDGNTLMLHHRYAPRVTDSGAGD
jgi:catechol 2,3-dioxygenase-like lactoylglutathione lyase family enzyme